MLIGSAQEAELRKLAGSHKMGTDARKAIFMVMMDSEDYLDAAVCVCVCVFACV